MRHIFEHDSDDPLSRTALPKATCLTAQGSIVRVLIRKYLWISEMKFYVKQQEGGKSIPASGLMPGGKLDNGGVIHYREV